MAKTTKKEYFEILRSYADEKGNTGAVDFIDHELELLAKKNASKSNADAAHKEENAALTQTLLDYVRGSTEPVSAADLIAHSDGLSSQKVSSLIAPLVDDGTVIKTKVKGKIYYTLA